MFNLNWYGFVYYFNKLMENKSWLKLEVKNENYLNARKANKSF